MKIIPWFDWKYSATKDWNIYSHIWKGRFLKPFLNSRGYRQVRLLNRKLYLVHRLVALTYIPNPDMKIQINHIDWNTINNCLENLEWCTQKENMIHSVKILWRRYLSVESKCKKPIRNIDIKGKIISSFSSLTEASKNTWLAICWISRCANWKQEHCWWYFWEYF